MRRLLKLRDRNHGNAYALNRQRRSPRPSLDPTAGRLALAAGPVQQHLACRQQLTATHERDHGLVRFRKDSNE